MHYLNMLIKYANEIINLRLIGDGVLNILAFYYGV